MFMVFYIFTFIGFMRNVICSAISIQEVSIRGGVTEKKKYKCKKKRNYSEAVTAFTIPKLPYSEYKNCKVGVSLHFEV